MSHYFENLNKEETEEHFSNFLFDSCSFSKVANFARNEKDFEKNYIYCEPYRSSAANIAGSAYHSALETYFKGLRDGEICDLVWLEKIAFEYTDAQPADKWKLQKTTPTIESCIKKAYDTTTKFLHNFYAEKSVYESNLKKVLAVEEYYTEWITINGVDIPLPFRAKIDLVFEAIDGGIILADHKTKSSFSDDQEAMFTIGKQAMTYVLIYEKKWNVKVSEVWFVENKHSKNKDGSDQLKPIKVIIDDDTRKLYGYMLYEATKRMLEAISNPDYIYLPNDSDDFIDKAEMYEFYCRTMLADIEDFPLIPENKKELVAKRLKKIKDSSVATISPTIVKNFKRNASEFIVYNLSNKDMTNEEKIEHSLKTLSVSARVEKTFEGYSSNTYLLEVGAGTKISSLFKYRLDIANALSVSSVRMMPNLFQYEGKSFLALEASKKREKDLMWDAKYLDGVKIPLGVDNFGETIYWDLNDHSTPHMLIGGSTGSGKTVFMVSILEYAKLAGFEKIIIFDPKYMDFKKYHKDSAVEVFNDISDIEFQIGYLVEEMNELIRCAGFQKTLIICDEYADLVQTARKQKQLGEGEKTLGENIQLLLQKSRALGFNIVIATQRSSVKVINGDIKVNLPIQVSFRVNKEIDSKVILDESGGEVLSGYGDGLIKSPSYLNTIRFQAFYKP